jgi:hypothetical protein
VLAVRHRREVYRRPQLQACNWPENDPPRLATGQHDGTSSQLCLTKLGKALDYRCHFSIG